MKTRAGLPPTAACRRDPRLPLRIPLSRCVNASYTALFADSVPSADLLTTRKTAIKGESL